MGIIEKYSGEKYEITFDRIRHLITLKSNISDFYSHTKIKISSDDDLSLDKTINMQKCRNTYEVFFSKNQNH